MAAICSKVISGCLSRSFLRQTGKPSRGRHPLSVPWNYRLLLKSHLHTVFECRSPATRTLLGRRRHGKFLWVNTVAVRHNSSQIPVETMAVPVVDISPPAPVLDSSPELLSAVHPPVLSQPFIEQVADAAPAAVDVLQAVATEASLAELGLTTYTPPGMIRSFFEFMHVDLGLPWWGAIVAGTVLARVLVFPVILKGQRETVKLNNVMPDMKKLMNKMNEAKQSGNNFEFAKASSDLNLFYKKHDVNPLRGFIAPLVQAPLFLSFFLALKGMASLPVPSMQTGGLLWFPDLTAADPLYILPVATTVTLFLIIELGAEAGLDNANMEQMKKILRAIPFVMLLFTHHFPTAVFTYWLTSNLFSLGQVLLLKQPLIREKFRIPERIQHPASAMSNADGFIKGIKKGWKNAQMAQLVAEREGRIKNHLEFAAKGPLRQTFTHNPLKQIPPVAAAKGRPAGGKTKHWED